jgi:hypothetical protein
MLLLRTTLMAITAAMLGCEGDLGPCQEAAAQELVYGRGGLVATKGQALMHDSCGNAAFCHSGSATGDARYGVPHGLDFDMLPAPGGWSAVREHEAEIWALVQDGEMPPKGVGDKTQGDGDWRFDPQRRADSVKLPALSTEEGQAAMRNWLACGAPVVEDTQAPAWVAPAQDGGTGDLADWSDIHATVIEPSCAIGGCHDASAAGKLVLLDACDAYGDLLGRGACGMPRLVPGDGASVLLEKLQATQQSCGTLRMPPPPLPPLPAATVEGLRAWIEAGAPAKECQ